MAEVYVSIDIETDGPFPGPNSMLSLGAAAFLRGNPEPIATFEANLKPLEGANPDPKTAEWWSQQDPKVLEHVTKNPSDPAEVMRTFLAWTKRLPGTPVMVVYPTWDSVWVTWYFGRFCYENPFGIGALDLKSMAFGLKNGRDRFKGISKKAMPKEWFAGAPRHDHTALTDAIGQGVLLIHMLEA